MRIRGRSNNAQTRSAPGDKVNAIPDELLELVFLRLTSPPDLVRAAFTCRRWYHVIAGDGFRVLASLHGAPPSHVVGHYHVAKVIDSRPPGFIPHFFPSSSSPWTGILPARNLALDFLVPTLTPYGDSIRWELADIRGGLLLLLQLIGYRRLLYKIIVCDPLARQYKRIPISAWFHNWDSISAVLLDGEDAGRRISLSNLRLSCAFYRDGVAKAYTFSSAAGGTWTSGATTACGSRVICANDYLTDKGPVRFEGSAGGSMYWSVGNDFLALDKETGELSLSVLPDALRGKPLVQDLLYELPWPPTIRALTRGQAMCGGAHRP